MAITPAFSPKRLAEQRKLTFDFVNELAVGETISTKAVTASVYSGTDPSPGNIISGVAVHSGSKVTQLVIGGVEGVTYLLVCAITTSEGQTIHGTAHLKVTDKT